MFFSHKRTLKRFYEKMKKKMESRRGKEWGGVLLTLLNEARGKGCVWGGVWLTPLMRQEERGVCGGEYG